MSEYSIRPGGSLKLRGGVAEGGIVKKKRKKKKKLPKAEILTEYQDRDTVEELSFQEGKKDNVPSGSGRNSPISSSSSRKTEAEKRFEEAQKRRLDQRVAKLANKTHKDRVNEFNAHLESLSEHHDIPKVGPG